MPTGVINGNIKIVPFNMSPDLSIAKQVTLHFTTMKQKMFAFAQLS
jgi:hypothetical protein